GQSLPGCEPVLGRSSHYQVDSTIQEERSPVRLLGRFRNRPSHECMFPNGVSLRAHTRTPPLSQSQATCNRCRLRLLLHRVAAPLPETEEKTLGHSSLLVWSLEHRSAVSGPDSPHREARRNS